MLGGIHPGTYSGALNYTAVTHESFYCVRMVGDATSCGTYIDTGSPFLTLAPHRYATVTAPIFSHGNDPCLQTYGRTCLHRGSDPCGLQGDIGDFPDVVVELEGVRLVIPPTKYFGWMEVAGSMRLCLGIVPAQRYATSGLTEYQNVLGLVVLEAYTTHFDLRHRRIGFGKVAGCDPCTSSTFLNLNTAKGPYVVPSDTCASHTACISCTHALRCAWQSGACIDAAGVSHSDVVGPANSAMWYWWECHPGPTVGQDLRAITSANHGPDHFGGGGGDN